ncbi:Hypothetical protein NTJ_00303 [Nesidiocoris tenuis]|uniref:Uncharacterized protein n=1 Tax=Nesidiocoris tenuis TaxID=355587 RepID=A0ABN7A6F6_9HEMI|nr:Hypothetical protein NTJ_00303 [Nesidiocoris tenuis]
MSRLQFSEARRRGYRFSIRAAPVPRRFLTVTRRSRSAHYDVIKLAFQKTELILLLQLLVRLLLRQLLVRLLFHLLFLH